MFLGRTSPKQDCIDCHGPRALGDGSSFVDPAIFSRIVFGGDPVRPGEWSTPPVEARVKAAIRARYNDLRDIAAAEAHAREVELQATANAQRVKLEAEADAERVRLQAAAEAQHVKLDAGAHAEATRAIGEAEASATTAKGLAEGEAVRAKGIAEAEAIKARADALAENQDAVIGQQLAEHWPAIVEAAAKPFGNIDQMIVLNGAQGLSETLAQALSQGVAGLQLARNVLNGNSNNSGDPKPETPS